MPEQPERTDRTWCTSCRLVALNGSGDRNSHHLCAGRGQDGSGLCACSIPGCHLPRELAIRPGTPGGESDG